MVTDNLESRPDLRLTEEYPLGDDGRAKFHAKVGVTFVFRHNLLLLDLDFGNAAGLANPPREVITGKTPLEGLRNAIASIDQHLARARQAIAQKKREVEPVLKINEEEFRKI